MVVNYDNAVEYYDATRGYRDGVVERYRDALLESTESDFSTRFLELGVGSGLIAQPFLRAAQDYFGIDLSRGMMRLIPGKLGGSQYPRLAQSDARFLPFAAASFDIVHAVRVFHHLPDWRDCIDEARRLLRTGGALVIVENIPPADADPPPWGIVQDKWDEILRGLGVGNGIRHGIWLTDESMSEYIRSTGATAKTVDLLRYLEKPVSPRIMVARRVARMFSSDWRLPEAVHREAARELGDWLACECEAPDDMVEREMVFRAVIARW
jgi:ubiquinone/menaquinone biosynthesis C-methylase UbiE